MKSHSNARVAVCMATYEPPARLFEEQIESIRKQTHRNFTCVISDDASSPQAQALLLAATARDERFRVVRHECRVGFYRNFERALSLVPADSDVVALADQDDVWEPEKLESLLRALEENGAELAFSDSRLLDERGNELSATYWRGRRPEFDDLASMMLMNSVTGAASLFRRALLDDALPFPDAVTPAFHDHWLAVVARARGSIAYVDRPLQRYVQHDANVAGAFVASIDYRGGPVWAIYRFFRSPRARLKGALGHLSHYGAEAARVELFAGTLETRLGTRLAPSDRSLLRRLVRLESPRSMLWLLRRSLADVRGRSSTLGAELHLLEGVLWRRRRVRRSA